MIRKQDWKIDERKVALVTVDVQRAFLEPGVPRTLSKFRDIVPGINELVSICRNLEIPVIHVGWSPRADLSDIGLVQEIRPIALTGSEFDYLEGKKGAEFYKDLDIKEGDYVVKKIRYSALISGASDLEPLLRGLGRDSFIVCGGATDVCLGMTAIDAMMLGFRVFVVSDLTVTFTEERQRVALEVLDAHFAKVMTFEEVKGELE